MRRADALTAGAMALGPWALTAWLSRRVVTDYWHGLLTLSNAVRVGGAGLDVLPATVRPAGASLLLAPMLSAVYSRGGPFAALFCSRLAMTGCFGALVAATYLFVRPRAGRAAAAAAAICLAADPLALRCAPFALFDIAAGLASVAFFSAAWRSSDEPTPGNRRLCALAYAAAVATRFHLAILIVAPLAWRLAEARPGNRAVILRDRLWPALLAAGGAAAVATVFITFKVKASWADAIARTWRWSIFLVMENLVHPRNPSPRSTYLIGLARELGPRWSCLALAGAAVWIVRRRREDARLAICLATPLTLMSLAIGNRDPRYALCFVPLVYAALGTGVQEALRALAPGARWRPLLAAAAAISLAPWQAVSGALWALANDPALHSPIFADFAREAASLAPGDCIGWIGRGISIPGSPEDVAISLRGIYAGDLSLAFYSPRRIKVLGGGESSDSCPVSLIVSVRRGTDGPLARLYRPLEPINSPKWRDASVTEDGIVARGVSP